MEVLAAFTYVKVTPTPQDEMEYLLSTENNRRELLESVAQLERGEGEAYDFQS